MAKRRKKDSLKKYSGGNGVRNWKLSIGLFVAVAAVCEFFLIRGILTSEDRTMMVLMTLIMTLVFASFLFALLRLGPSVKGEDEGEAKKPHAEANGASEPRKRLRVAAAVIFDKDGNLLAAERGYGAYEGKFEFPGGKLEEGETAEAACKREIREELGAEITIYKEIAVTKESYPEYDVELHAFLATLEGEIELREHHSVRWLAEGEWDDVPWLPSDLAVIDILKERGAAHWTKDL